MPCCHSRPLGAVILLSALGWSACGQAPPAEAPSPDPLCAFSVGSTTMDEVVRVLGPPPFQWHVTDGAASRFLYAVRIPNGCRTARVLFNEARILSGINVKPGNRCSLIGPEVALECPGGR